MKKYFFSFFVICMRLLQGRGWGDRVPWLRILRSVSFVALKPHGIVPAKVGGMTLFVDARDAGEAGDLLVHGVYSPYETVIFLSLLKSGMVVADIGAHIGYFTLLAARAVGSAGRVYAFEPDRSNRELLLRSVAASKMSNVVVEMRALSDHAGEKRLFLDRSNFGNMSFAPENISIDARAGSVAIETTTIDEYFASRPAPQVIKIDVQGAEGLVCAGGEQTLKKVSAVLMEFWPFGLQNMGTDPCAFLEQLSRAGFVFYILQESTRSLKHKKPDQLLSVAHNRPEGKGWTNILCARAGFLSTHIIC